MDLAIALGTVTLALAAQAPPAPPKPEPALGPLVRVVWIASSTCGPCKAPEVQQAITAATEAVRAWAKSHGHDFVYTGVATDEDVARGYEFLSHHGPFDEVVIGHGWLNLGVTTFIVPYVGEPLAELGMPQLVVTLEEYRLEGSTLRAVRAPRVAFRSIGSLIPRHATPGNVRSALDEAARR
jgi:hypothetical protein